MYTRMFRTYAEHYKQGIHQMRKNPEAGVGVLEYAVIGAVLLLLALGLAALFQTSFANRSAGIN